MPDSNHPSSSAVLFEPRTHRNVSGGRVLSRRSGRQRLQSGSVAALAKAKIDVSFRARVSLASLSRDCNVSREHLCRAFKSQFAVTVTDYVRARRIEEALTLMSDPTLQLKKVGLAVGYANYNEFFRAFKRVMSITPTLYLRRHVSAPREGSLVVASE